MARFLSIREAAELLRDAPRISVLAGAGMSAPAPTCLPGWWAVNSAVLGALGDAIEELTGRSGLSGGFRDAIQRRRDTTPFLKPDLQAQLIEDEIGEDYFRALGALDSDAPNAAHGLLAVLAQQDRIASIMTTNFDGTIERAFEAAGIPYRLFTSPEDFGRLDDTPSALPIVKIHGSASRPETVVDTLRQRLQHRPESLEKWMRRRFVEAPTIVLGFSGEDLQYDPDYLGLRPAARDGARFFFLVRTGSTPSVPLERLATECPVTVALCEGELPAWPFELTEALGIEHSVELRQITSEVTEQRRAEAVRRLDESLHTWAASLGAMKTMNAVAALLASAGFRHDADILLRRMWSFYRAPEDTTGPAYARYLHNYGETLLRGGRLHNPYDRESEFAAWKDAADHDPRQFFFRAVHHGGGPDSRARSLLCEFLAGARVSSLASPLAELLASAGNEQRRDTPLSRAWVDACFSLADLLELLALGQAATGLLEAAHRSSVAAGDEFRRSEAAWRLARNLAFGIPDDASLTARVGALATECQEIANRLDISEADCGASLARAIAAIAARDFDAAEEHAKRGEERFRALEDAPGEIFAKRERLRALIGKSEESGKLNANVWDELSLALQSFAIDNAPGLRPLIKYELALFATRFDDELASQLAHDAAEDARLQEHPFLVAKAAELRDAVAK